MIRRLLSRWFTRRALRERAMARHPAGKKIGQQR